MSNAIGEPVSLEPLKESRPSWLKLVKAAANAWVADYAPSMGAALSYYSVFSMAPLLLVVISIAGLVFGEDAVRGEVFGQLQSLLGADAAKAVQAILASVSDKPAQGVLSTVIGAIVAFVVSGITPHRARQIKRTVAHHSVNSAAPRAEVAVVAVRLLPDMHQSIVQRVFGQRRVAENAPAHAQQLA